MATSHRSSHLHQRLRGVGDDILRIAVIGIFFVVVEISFLHLNHDRITVDGFAIGAPTFRTSLCTASKQCWMIRSSDRTAPERNISDIPRTKSEETPDPATPGIRLNKVFTQQFSRRAADQLIQNGRVKVNGVVVADMGRRVIPFRDVVHLDDQVYTDWEVHCDVASPLLPHTEATSEIPMDSNAASLHQSPHVYIKYWKPVGVVSTTDRTVPNNLIDAMYDVTMERRYDSRHRKTLLQRRIFNVGRLDKDSSGLLLLTSDGRIPNVVLSKHYNHSKVYYVRIDRPISQAHLQQLQDGIVITTDTVRQGKHRAFTARTLPCTIEPLYPKPLLSSTRTFQPTTEMQITLTEGRNRQIRVMLQTVGQYEVLELHRLQFMGQQIDLSNLQQPGDWTFLNATEVAALQDALRQSQAPRYAAEDGD